MRTQLSVDVLIAGGGPFGLMLANELGRRGVRAAVFDAKGSTAVNPQANATQARTMEHYRRLGFADEVRGLGLPGDFATDIAYFTRFATHELARFRLPSAREAQESVRTLGGSWSAAELPHRIWQKYVEQVLRRHAEALPGISVNYGWELTGFAETADGVTASLAERGGPGVCIVTARYLVGADGARSFVRRQLGIGWTGETGVIRDFFGGRMYAIYLSAPRFYEVAHHPRARMQVTFNRDRRAFMAAVDGREQFAFHTQLRAGADERRITERDALDMAVGAEIDATILSRDSWTAGPGSLDSYEHERRRVAVRNTGYARGFAESLGSFTLTDGIEDDTARGGKLRREAGAYLERHGRAEYNIPGITFGARYDGSPVLWADGSTPPPDAPNTYEPCAAPGGRAPHQWLDDGRSLFDAFGFDWTVLRLGPKSPPVDRFAAALRGRGLDLTALDVPTAEARDLYAAPLALIRPDQVVAWRGTQTPRRRR